MCLADHAEYSFADCMSSTSRIYLLNIITILHGFFCNCGMIWEIELVLPPASLEYRTFD